MEQTKNSISEARIEAMIEKSKERLPSVSQTSEEVIKPVTGVVPSIKVGDKIGIQNSKESGASEMRGAAAPN